jgi:hypothetical protein
MNGLSGKSGWSWIFIIEVIHSHSLYLIVGIIDMCYSSFIKMDGLRLPRRLSLLNRNRARDAPSKNQSRYGRYAYGSSYMENIPLDNVRLENILFRIHVFDLCHYILLHRSLFTHNPQKHGTNPALLINRSLIARDILRYKLNSYQSAHTQAHSHLP